MPNTSGNLNGKVAFVTGAASGIGRATALAFTSEGANVVVADIDQRRNQDTVRMIEDLGGQAHAVNCDVTRGEDVQSALTQTVERFGRLTTPSTTPAPNSSQSRPPRSPKRNGIGSSPSTSGACSCA